jgi:hypothetical protein
VVESVTVTIDGGASVEADLTPVLHAPVPTVRFAASLPAPDGPGVHRVTVVATDDRGVRVSGFVDVVVPAPSCSYPTFTATARPILDELAAIAARPDLGTSIYLDTRESHSHDEWPPCGIDTEGEDHHQGLARTPRLGDGSVVFFLSHSETDDGDRGNLMFFGYPGPPDGEHVLTTSPLTVAPLGQLLEIQEQHPCDLSFLPELDHADAGYLFVAEQRLRRVRVYRWTPEAGLVVRGQLALPDGVAGPNFVFLGAEDDRYLLGIVPAYSDGPGTAQVFTADAVKLYRGCVHGALDVSAFRKVGDFPFPVAD